MDTLDLPAPAVQQADVEAAPAQDTEVRIAVNVLNRMLDLGSPNSVRSA